MALAFARRMGEYGSVVLIAAKVKIAEPRDLRRRRERRAAAAAALSVVLLALALLVLVALRR